MTALTQNPKSVDERSAKEAAAASYVEIYKIQRMIADNITDDDRTTFCTVMLEKFQTYLAKRRLTLAEYIDTIPDTSEQDFASCSEFMRLLKNKGLNPSKTSLKTMTLGSIVEIIVDGIYEFFARLETEETKRTVTAFVETCYLRYPKLQEMSYLSICQYSDRVLQDRQILTMKNQVLQKLKESFVNRPVDDLFKCEAKKLIFKKHNVKIFELNLTPEERLCFGIPLFIGVFVSSFIAVDAMMSMPTSCHRPGTSADEEQFTAHCFNISKFYKMTRA